MPFQWGKNGSGSQRARNRIGPDERLHPTRQTHFKTCGNTGLRRDLCEKSFSVFRRFSPVFKGDFDVAKLDMTNFAWPVASRVLVPSLVAPSQKVTVAPGMYVAGLTLATVAVKVTGWPKATEPAFAVTDVVVVAFLITALRIVEVLLLKL